MLFRFRDSLNLLPGKLSELAKNLCPDLGTKGSIPYDEVKDLEVRKTLYYSPRSIFPLFFCSFNALLVDWKCARSLSKLSVDIKFLTAEPALDVEELLGGFLS
ncbi:hypothetical protein V6N11_014311 [Hibiscus sabdariffa]|uniref:Uncharacterized protein n=2 Tax=Hibiscus sabdariffa TaxID=183260 RepID=A0ABR2BF61_9ROSI